MVELSDHLKEAFNIFNNLFADIVIIHAPLKKFMIKPNLAPWRTDEIRDLMNQRDAAKMEAKTSGLLPDWAVYRKLRNYVVKINRETKKEYFSCAINWSKRDSKSMWKTISNLLWTKHHSTLAKVGNSGEILTKSKDVANHLATFFEDMLLQFRQGYERSD